MKAFATFVLVLAGLVPTHADTTQTWNLTANCVVVGPYTCTDPANISATLTTQMTSGTYVDISGTGEPFQDTLPLITSITGTYDGQAMFLMGEAPWVDSFVGDFPQSTEFMAGGNDYFLYWAGLGYISLFDSPNPEVLNWTSVDPIPSVPEPSTLLLLTAPLLLVLSKWAQTSLRKPLAH